jgi:hypothetical protein
MQESASAVCTAPIFPARIELHTLELEWPWSLLGRSLPLGRASIFKPVDIFQPMLGMITTSSESDKTRENTQYWYSSAERVGLVNKVDDRTMGYVLLPHHVTALFSRVENPMANVSVERRVYCSYILQYQRFA